MRTLLIFLCLLIVQANLGGCASLKAYPDRSDDPEAELNLLKKYFEPQIIQTYDQKADAADKKALRNEIVNGRLRSYDIQFNLFQQSLFREGVTTNIATDWITLGLGGAIATVGGEATKAALV